MLIKKLNLSVTKKSLNVRYFVMLKESLPTFGCFPRQYQNVTELVEVISHVAASYTELLTVNRHTTKDVEYIPTLQVLLCRQFSLFLRHKSDKIDSPHPIHSCSHGQSVLFL